jgi:hypothetical protein
VCFETSHMCTDVTSDPANCGGIGGAGYRCPAGQSCKNGVCSGAVSPCTSGHVGQFCDATQGTICCPGGGCTDPRTDAANCGACGQACPSGQLCIGGNCKTTSCTKESPGSGCVTGANVGQCCDDVCADTSVDPANCGTCGTKCPGSETCRAGHCGLDSCESSTNLAPCHLACDRVGTCMDGQCN